jgi:hypothetical protein
MKDRNRYSVNNILFVKAVCTAMVPDCALDNLLMLACRMGNGRQCIPWTPQERYHQAWLTRSLKTRACVTGSEVCSVTLLVL